MSVLSVLAVVVWVVAVAFLVGWALDWKFTDRDEYSIRYPTTRTLVDLREALAPLLEENEQ